MSVRTFKCRPLIGKQRLICFARREHETFWFRGHGIEGSTHVEENHDPRYNHDQSCLLPLRYCGNLESAPVREERQPHGWRSFSF